MELRTLFLAALMLLPQVVFGQTIQTQRVEGNPGLTLQNLGFDIALPAAVCTLASTADIATHAALTATHGATGAVVGTTNTQTLTNKTFTDNVNTFQDETDNTKKFQFNASFIGTGTTRTYDLPNVSGGIVVLGSNQTLTGVFLSESLQWFNASDTSKRLQMDLSQVPTGRTAKFRMYGPTAGTGNYFIDFPSIPAGYTGIGLARSQSMEASDSLFFYCGTICATALKQAAILLETDETALGVNEPDAPVNAWESKLYGWGNGLRIKNAAGVTRDIVTSERFNTSSGHAHNGTDSKKISGSDLASAVPISLGGTGQTAKAAAFDALSPNSTLGDLTYHNGTNNVRLAGNTTTTQKFLAQTGNGTVSAAPVWNALVAGDIPSLDTSKLGTGTLGVARGGTGVATIPTGELVVGAGTSAVTTVAPSTSGNLLQSNGSAWVSTIPRVQTKYLSSDATTNSTTTTAKITGLDLTVPAGTYQFKYMIRHQSAATTTGVKFDVNHTGTVTTFLWNEYFVDATAASTTAAHDQDEILATAAVVNAFASRAKGTAGRGTSVSVDTANSDMLTIIEGMMIVTVSGNLELYHGSEVAAATTVKAGSSLVLTKVD